MLIPFQASLQRTLASSLLALSLACMAGAALATPDGFATSIQAAGTLNRTSLTVNLTAGSADQGRNANIYVVAVLPANASIFALTASGWQAVSGNDLPAYRNATLGSHSLPILSQTDVSALAGAAIYVAYGDNLSDIANKQSYAKVYTVAGGLAGAAAAGDFLTFGINTQDFSYPDKSAATLTRIVDMHEKYQIPVDIYLTDTMLDIYQTQYPSLLARLTSSPYVALSYHIRPPKPYYTDLDWAGLAAKSSSEQLASVTSYETHVTDLVTGQPSSKSGGYAGLKSLLAGTPAGASPAIAAFQTDSSVYDAVNMAFKNLGATWTISHSLPYINLGQSVQGLFVRPEHYDLKLFEHPGESAQTLISGAFSTAHDISGTRAPYVVGVKMHDNDFFAKQSAWATIYLGSTRTPPWDTTPKSALKSDADIAAQWTLYEGAVSYAAANRSRYGQFNAMGMEQLRQSIPSAAAYLVSCTMHIESQRANWPNVDQLIAFFRRLSAAGMAGNQTTGMRCSIGADSGWLNGEPRAAEVISTLSALGVEWDIHAHAATDRVKNAEKIAALGGTPNGVVSGIIYTEIDGVRAEQTSSSGYRWQAQSLWGVVISDGHTLGADDVSYGLWRPVSTADWKSHDPAANLIIVGGGGRNLEELESFAGKLAAGGYCQPLYSATLNLAPKTLTVVGGTDGIDKIESWAARMGAMSNVKWASLSQTASAWTAAGGIPSRVTP